MNTNTITSLISKEFNLSKMTKKSSYKRDNSSTISTSYDKSSYHSNGDFYVEKIYGNQFCVFLESKIAKELTLDIVEYLISINGDIAPKTMDELEAWSNGKGFPIFNFQIIVNFS